MPWIQYKNGNYLVFLNLNDGTKIRYTDDAEFNASRPESMDVKITNRCSHGCMFCHENSSGNGDIADISFGLDIVSTLPPFCEIAVGGGNLMANPEHTESFLKMLISHKAVPSITLHQSDFIANIDLIYQWIENKFVHGVGVSLSDASDKLLIDCMQSTPNTVLHVINGMFSEKDYELLANKGLKILVLGYKNIRRGKDYLFKYGESVSNNQQWLKDNLESVFQGFRIVSFDNLALEQLPVRETIGEEKWSEFFMGEDGSTTFYIDLVEREFAKSSTSLQRYFIQEGNEMLDVQSMFDIIRRERE